MTGKLLDGVRGFVSALRVIAGLLLIGSITLNFVNVVARYFFHASIFWAEEIMLYMMVGCVFLGNGVVAWSGRQLRMDVIVGMMPPKARDAFDLLAELTLIGTSLTIVWFAWPVIRDLFHVRPAQPVRGRPDVHSAGHGPDRPLDHGAAGRRPIVDRRRSHDPASPDIERGAGIGRR